MALFVNDSTHLIPAYYSLYRPRKDERLSWPSWLTCSGRLTHISGHPSAAGRAQDRRSTTVPRHQSKSTRYESHIPAHGLDGCRDGEHQSPYMPGRACAQGKSIHYAGHVVTHWSRVAPSVVVTANEILFDRYIMRVVVTPTLHAAAAMPQ